MSNLVLFKKGSNQTIIDYLNNLPSEPLIENLIRLFSSLGKNIIAELSSTKIEFPSFPRNVLGEILEDGWGCHHTAPNLSAINENILCVYGFADNYINEEYSDTFCHSFLISKDGKILYDPQIEFMFEELDLVKKRARNYFGVVLPPSFVKEMIDGSPKNVTRNLSKYLKENVLASYEETKRFIDRIKEEMLITEA